MSRTGETGGHKYRQIYNELRRDIVLGKYSVGALLPSETELMQLFGAGRNTVRHAIELLREKGLVEVRQGSGVTVIDAGYVHKLNDINDSNGAPRRSLEVEYYDEEGQSNPDALVVSSAPSVDFAPAPLKVARVFGIEEETPVFRLQRIWKMNDAPFIYMVQYVNTPLVPDLAERLDDMVTSIYRVLEDFGLSFISAKETISCVNADFLAANLLRVEMGAALLHTIRVARCEKGAFEYADIYSVPKYTGYSSQVNVNTSLHKTEYKASEKK